MKFIKRYEAYIYLILIFAVAFNLQNSVALIGLDLHHDLIMFDAARNFHSGFLPYRDFFYQYNYGTVLIHSIALYVWGVKISSLKLITVYFYASIATLIYLCCAIQGLKRWGAALALMWSLLSPFYSPLVNGYHPWPTIYAITFVMAGATLLLLAMRRQGLWSSLLAGAFFSTAFWMKQVVAYQILAVMIWIGIGIYTQAFKQKSFRFSFYKIAISFCLGGVIAAVPYAWYLISNNLFHDWVNNTIIFNKYFSMSGESKNQIFNTFFPVNRTLGFRSIIWSIIPSLVLIGFYSKWFLGGGTSTRGIHPERFYAQLLFLMLTIAGWAEYFPLPHPFHLQIFMAPAFVCVAMLTGDILKNGKTISDNKLISLSLFITLGMILYESGMLLSKQRIKTNQEFVTISKNTPFDKLRLSEVDAKKLMDFYKNLLKVTKISKSGEPNIIPLSTDPLRALLPGSVSAPGKFKMGLDWSWPNEIVEAGFNELVKRSIQEKKYPIYSDSILAIPGYRLISILEMQSPVTDVHTLYTPISNFDRAKIINESFPHVFYGSSGSLFDLEDRALIENSGANINLALIPTNFDGYDISQIDQIDLSYISNFDIPKKLDKLYYMYLKKSGVRFDESIAKYYTLTKNGTYELKKDLGREELLNIEKFYLSTGKIIHKQNVPKYLSGLVMSRPYQIFIASKVAQDKFVRVEWVPGASTHIQVQKGERSNKRYYIVAIPSIFDKNSQGMIAVQITMKDGSALTKYIDFNYEELPKRNEFEIY